MTEPVSLDDIKVHLRLGAGETGEDDADPTAPVDASEDDYLQALIVAARRACELRIGCAIVTAEASLTLDRFPASPHRHDGVARDATIFLPAGTVTAVEQIAYRATDGTEQLLDVAEYVADLTRSPARIGPIGAWPTTARTPGAVIVRYTLAPLTDDDLQIVCHAIRLLVGNWYANREGAVVDTRGTPAELPLAVKWLLEPLRLVATP
ncbi:hypothetical protein [Sphingomonas sp. BAUL-RG-20F-R05-02]|uniref:head-tail connector protein n=1 Tax=Sphingomonas sp. BAUL-RG-20F-R05-02 TaxID=2914830 RepID=UPI001F57F75F|nr:hypothetical protein [Sphingomonas sp. BAUL-RG-20F-R05-02]